MLIFEVTNSNIKFRRTPAYTSTYLAKVKPYSKIRAKFRDFMETKRTNPNTTFSSSDKPFISKGSYGTLIPGIKHAHITHDLSIVYLLQGNTIIFYGFYTHDELGTGSPAKINIQKSMARRFKTMS